MHTIDTEAQDALALLSRPVRDWFAGAYPEGPTPAQRLAWPLIAAGEHLLLVSPTGTGKTLAGFLAILDRLFRAHAEGTLAPGLRCVYVSPLRSLGYDIERNLAIPLEGIQRTAGLAESPVRVGVRTGDTSPHFRRKLRDDPPHLLITTPESLSLLLSQASWAEHWRGVEHVIVDEVHALVPTKRGADLAVSLERLAVAPGAIPAASVCRPRAGRPSRWRGSWSGQPGPAGSWRLPCPAARLPWRSRSNRCSRRARLPIAGCPIAG